MLCYPQGEAQMGQVYLLHLWDIFFFIFSSVHAAHVKVTETLCGVCAVQPC